MKGREEIMSIVNLNGLVIEETANSTLLTAKKKLYTPEEKKIVLLDQITEKEERFLLGTTKMRGGLIV